MKKLLLIILIVSIYSCGDDDNPNKAPVDGNRKYINAEVGSYWYYETYSEDQNGQDSLVSKDSIVVVNELIFGGKEAIECRKFTMIEGFGGYAENGTIYFATDDNILYVHSEGFSNLIGGGGGPGDGFISPEDILNIESQWLILANKEESRWNVYQSNFESDIFGFDISGETDAKARRIPTSQLQKFAGKDYLVDEYDIVNEITANVNFNGFPIPINFSNELTFHIADNLGIVRIETISSDVSLPGFPSQETPPTDQKLIRFQIK